MPREDSILSQGIKYEQFGPGYSVRIASALRNPDRYGHFPWIEDRPLPDGVRSVKTHRDLLRLIPYIHPDDVKPDSPAFRAFLVQNFERLPNVGKVMAGKLAGYFLNNSLHEFMHTSEQAD